MAELASGLLCDVWACALYNLSDSTDVCMCDGLEVQGAPVISDIDRLEDNFYDREKSDSASTEENSLGPTAPRLRAYTPRLRALTEASGQPDAAQKERSDFNFTLRANTAIGPHPDCIESGSDIQNEGHEMLIRMMVASRICLIIRLQAVCRGFIQRVKYWRTKHKKDSDFPLKKQHSANAPKLPSSTMKRERSQSPPRSETPPMPKHMCKASCPSSPTNHQQDAHSADRLACINMNEMLDAEDRHNALLHKTASQLNMPKVTSLQQDSYRMMDLDRLLNFNVANINLENAQEVVLYHANAKRNAKKVTPAMVDGPPPDISKIPPPKVRTGGAKASIGNGAKKRDDAGLVLGQDALGCNIYKTNKTDSNGARVSFLHQLAVFNTQPGINKMSAEFGTLPWGPGLMKLAFQAAHINEIMTNLPGPRPITSVQAFRQWLTCMGYDLSRYKGPWFFLQFSPAVWNSQGSRVLENSPTKMGSGVKRTRAQAGI